MTIAKGISKKVGYKKETTWGVLSGASGGKYIRRVKSNFNLTKATYESQEIRTDYQVADMRHGIRSADGAIDGELAPGSYSDFIGSVLARNFTTGATATAGVTIAASGSLFTITRATGSYITDGFLVGSVVRLTGAGLNTANVGNNALVVSLSATALTIAQLSTTAFVPEGPIAAVTVAVVGKQTYAPLTGHTDDSYTFEEFYSDIGQSEVYTGMKVGSADIKLPSTGLVTCNFALKGKDMAQTGTSQYFTTPTASGTNGVFASVSGALVVNGAPVGLITQLDFKVDRGLNAADVVGSNVAADIFTGRIRVTGNFSTYFQDGVFRDYFNAENVVSLVVALSTGTAANADVISFTLPKVKVGSATAADAEMGIVRSHTFTALLNSDVSAGLAPTTILVQDTTL
jgi:Phage tail tube protein